MNNTSRHVRLHFIIITIIVIVIILCSTNNDITCRTLCHRTIYIYKYAHAVVQYVKCISFVIVVTHDDERSISTKHPRALLERLWNSVSRSKKKTRAFTYFFCAHGKLEICIIIIIIRIIIKSYISINDRDGDNGIGDDDLGCDHGRGTAPPSTRCYIVLCCTRCLTAVMTN